MVIKIKPKEPPPKYLFGKAARQHQVQVQDAPPPQQEDERQESFFHDTKIQKIPTQPRWSALGMSFVFLQPSFPTTCI